MKNTINDLIKKVDGNVIDKIVINKTTVSVKFTVERNSIVYGNRERGIEEIFDLDTVYRLEWEIKEAERKVLELKSARKKMSEDARNS